METRDFSNITACGEDCTGCAKRVQGLCGGCRELDGYCPEWAQSGRCPVHACAQEHSALFCGLCSQFPCLRLPELMHWKRDAVQQMKTLAELYSKQLRMDSTPDDASL